MLFLDLSAKFHCLIKHHVLCSVKKKKCSCDIKK